MPRARKTSAAAAAAILLARAAGVAAQNAVPNSDTTSFPANYQGMYLGPGSPPETMSCGSTETFVTSGGNGDCCVGTTCDIPVSCTDSVLTFGNGNTNACPNGYSCQAMTIYETSPFGLPVVTQWMCAVNWSANTIYRELAVTTAEPTHTATSAKPSHTRAAPHSTAPVSSAPSDSSSSDSSSSSSKAWIAGPVIGGLAALGLLGGLAFWWGRRAGHRNRPSPVAGGPVEMSNHHPPDTAYAGAAGGYTDAKGYYWPPTHGSPGQATIGPSPNPSGSWTAQNAGAPSPYATYGAGAVGAGVGGYTPVSQQTHYGGGAGWDDQHRASELASDMPVEMDGQHGVSSGGIPAAELADESTRGRAGGLEASQKYRGMP